MPAPALWDRESDDELVCLDVHPETHDVKTFTFASPAGKHFAFAAGQHLLFEVTVDGEAHGRCYTISSSPTRPRTVSVTVKRVPGGRVSAWFHTALKPGDTIRASGPLGAFVRPEASRKLLLLTAGSGVTPAISIAREAGDLATPADIAFVHFGRTPADLLFRHDLSGLARRVKGLRLHLVPETLGDDPSWPGLSGRISRDFLSLAVPDVAERVVMCCGPAPFMAAARTIARVLGVPEADYREESFEAAVIEEAPAPIPEAVVDRRFKVSFQKQNRTIEVAADQTVLAAAKRAGVRLPSSCATGLCGTCKSKLISGTVDMRHDGGIRQREVDAGFFLPCCSKPLEDLVVDR